MQSAQGSAAQGGQQVTTIGLTSTTLVQQSYPLCKVTVNVHGSGLATIFADNALTPLANPFTASATGYWDFYAANGRYDVTLSDNLGSGPASPILISDLILNDPAGGGGVVSAVFGRAGIVVAQTGDYTVSQVTGAAPLASPALTGVPTAPTAAPGTNTTQIATTAFVSAAIPTGAVISVFGRAGVVVALTGDYMVAQITGAAPNASPTFTGTPAAPTAAPGTNTTQLATTAFVQAAIPATGVTSVFGRGGVVVATTGDYTVAQVIGAAPLVSPALTGMPTAPTAALGDSSTLIATTQYVQTQGFLATTTGLTLSTPTIGGGAVINGVFMAQGVAPTAAWTSIAAQSGQEQTFTIAGVLTNGIASASPTTDLGNTNLVWSARVSAANTVTVRIVNPTSGALTPNAVNWNILVIQ